MRVLIDECVPRKIKRHLSGHDCRTVPEVGWSGKRNGELLSLAEQENYEIFLTLDKGIRHEQNVQGRNLAIVIMHANSNRLADLLPCVRDCLEQLKLIKPRQIVKVGLD